MRSCPVCDASNSRVYDSRTVRNPDNDRVVIRFRECTFCNSRWRTEECFVRMVEIEGTKTRADQMRDGSIPSNLIRLKAACLRLL